MARMGGMPTMQEQLSVSREVTAVIFAVETSPTVSESKGRRKGVRFIKCIKYLSSYFN